MIFISFGCAFNHFKELTLSKFVNNNDNNLNLREKKSLIFISRCSQPLKNIWAGCLWKPKNLKYPRKYQFSEKKLKYLKTLVQIETLKLFWIPLKCYSNKANSILCSIISGPGRFSGGFINQRNHGVLTKFFRFIGIDFESNVYLINMLLYNNGMAVMSLAISCCSF